MGMSKTQKKDNNLLLKFAEEVKTGKRRIISISDIIEESNINSTHTDVIEKEFTMTIKGIKI